MTPAGGGALVEVRPQSPLYADWVEDKPASIRRTGLDVHENPARRKVLVTTDGNAEILHNMETALGAPLPAGPDGVTGDDPCCLWQAPNRWLICYGKAHGLAERLMRACSGFEVAILDVSDGFVSIDIADALAYALLVRGCELDLHRRVFGPGRFAATQIAGIDVLVHSRAQGEGYEILVDRSLAADLWMWLKDRAKLLAD
jgi:sarcosine oxidase subunit gamma